MYTEEYEHKGFPFKDFLLKLILIIIFVFLLIWLLPKFITPTTIVKENNKVCSDIIDINTKSGSNGNNNSTQISVSSTRIFQENLERMKEAAISYFTDDRLPSEVGESKTMTLSAMIGEKIITPLIDGKNKACDVDKSYVKITKADDEYILKVNLKDSENEDYILVHLGCYTYCKSTICEKDYSNIAIKGSKSTSNANNYSPVITIRPAKQDDYSTNNSSSKSSIFVEIVIPVLIFPVFEVAASP